MRRDPSMSGLSAPPHGTGITRWIVALLALVVALVTVTPAPVAAQQDPKPPRQTLPSEQVSAEEIRLGQLALEYRRLHRRELWGPTAKTNVAVALYEHDGQQYTITVGSVSYQNRTDENGNVVLPTAIFDIRDANDQLVGRSRYVQRFENPDAKKHGDKANVTSRHSEQLIFLQLLEMGVNPAGVTELWTDLEPCLLPGRRCAYKVAERFPEAKVFYGNEYGGDPAMTKAEQEKSRKRGLSAHAREITQFHESLDAAEAAAQQLFTTDGGGANGSIVPLVAGGQPPPGGIDFRALELRYIAEGGSGDEAGLAYSLAAGPGSGVFQADRTVRAAQRASDAFFVWLSLSPDRFWVNLSPDEPDRIVDEQFGRTHAGRVLLEADLELKKTVAKLIHPDSKLGRKYWKRLRSNDRGEMCLSFRQWIVPKPAVVHDDGASLTILEAPLDVKLESEYIEDVGGVAQGVCAPDQRTNEEHNEAVFREMILPRVRKAVNNAPEYADLRRVYTSRVAAEWYRTRSLAEDTAYGHLVDSGDISGWSLSGTWTPREVFDAYVDSYTNGEFNVTHETTEGNAIYETTYVFGGVDFSNVRFKEVGADDLLYVQAGVPAAIERSMTEVAADDSDMRWLGAVTTTAPQQSGVGPVDATDVDARDVDVAAMVRPVLAVWLAAIAVLLVLFVMLRRRRTARSASRVTPQHRP